MEFEDLFDESDLQELGMVPPIKELKKVTEHIVQDTIIGFRHEKMYVPEEVSKYVVKLMLR